MRQVKSGTKMALVAVLGLGACTTGMPDFRNLAPRTAPVTTPTPTVTQPPQQPAEVRLVSAIEASGCVLTGDNVGAVQLQSNLTRAELTATMARLEELGRVAAAGDGGIKVLTERCS